MKKHIINILHPAGFIAAFGIMAVTAALSGPLDASKLSFTSSLTTLDGLTNVIATIGVPSNRVARVEARFLAVGDSYHSASYGRIGTFRNMGGTNTIQVSITASIALAETDSACEALIGTDGTNVVLRVAGVGLGNTAIPFNWVAHVDVYYSDQFIPLAEHP